MWIRTKSPSPIEYRLIPQKFKVPPKGSVTPFRGDPRVPAHLGESVLHTTTTKERKPARGLRPTLKSPLGVDYLDYSIAVNQNDAWVRTLSTVSKRTRSVQQQQQQQQQQYEVVSCSSIHRSTTSCRAAPYIAVRGRVAQLLTSQENEVYYGGA